MGQYHRVVNLDKKEILDPHVLGNGLKLWEQLASHPGVGAALIVLLASASNGSGGGDLEADPMVGHWRGDRIAFVGDYDDDSEYVLKGGSALPGSALYGGEGLTDISLDVCKVIERELGGKYEGDGWRDFKYEDGENGIRGMKADMLIQASAAPNTEAVDLVRASLAAWEDEEESVKEEHAAHIASLRTFIEKVDAPAAAG